MPAGAQCSGITPDPSESSENVCAAGVEPGAEPRTLCSLSTCVLLQALPLPPQPRNEPLCTATRARPTAFLCFLGTSEQQVTPGSRGAQALPLCPGRQNSPASCWNSGVPLSACTVTLWLLT